MAFEDGGVALKGNADTVLYTQLIQATNDLLTKECPIHTHFDSRLWAGILDVFYTILNKTLSPAAIVNVAAAMMHRKYLCRLCNGAIQWIIAALAFLFLVESIGYTLCMATGAQH